MLKSLWRKPTETFTEILSRKIHWPKVLGLFAIEGIYFMFYLLRSEGLIDVGSNLKLFKSLFTLIIIGTIWGIISNLLIGFLIKVTGKLFQAAGTLRKIYTAMAWASIPLIFSSAIIFLNLIFVRIVSIEGEITTLKIFLSLLIIVLNLVVGVFALWHLILIFKGLKVAQDLNYTKTILNYVLAVIILSPIYYILFVLEY